MSEKCLQFYVGQSVEARSFQLGYRGAWWRCKIEKISRRKNVIFHDLKYLDFPDEKIHQTKLYQKIQTANKNLTDQRHLMVRPQFPPIYRRNQVSNLSNVSDDVVVVDDWKVGDLVDWWKDDCYWSGKITRILGDEKIQIELFPPPLGEGLSYKVSCNDLRPSLDWFPENGWMVPVSVDGEKVRCCTQVIKHANQGDSANFSKTLGNDKNGNHLKAPPSLEQKASFSSSTAAPPERSPHETVASEETHALKRKRSFNVRDGNVKKPVSSNSISSSHVRDTSVEMQGANSETVEEDNDLKKTKSNEGMVLNTMMFDTIEAAVFDLEELVNKIKWIKSLLDDVKPSSDCERSWKFVEHLASSVPR